MKERSIQQGEGLRIGKQLDERRRGEPPNERLEWERDGQYYHYLTKWMHALNCVGRVTGDPAYNRWAMELAQTAHAGFTYVHPGDGRKRMYWKMSIDLGYPLVLAMGQHDPLDGLVTYSELQALATGEFGESSWPDLSTDIGDMADICREEKWSTDDPLGIGGLLFDAWRIAQLMIKGGFGDPGPPGWRSGCGPVRTGVVRGRQPPEIPRQAAPCLPRTGAGHRA